METTVASTPTPPPLYPIKWNTQLFELGEPAYRLTESIIIVIEEYPDDETVIARFPALELFAEGTDEYEALSDLKRTILDLYDELMSGDLTEYGSLPQAWRTILKRLVEHKEVVA